MTILVEQAIDRQTTVTHDGYVIDLDTGEILDHIATQVTCEPRTPWVPVDQAGAEWVLQVRLEAASTIEGLEARRTAIIANIDKQIATERRKIEWLDYRFTGPLMEIAHTLLSHSKFRSVQTPFGRFGWRKGSQSIVVRDDQKAFAIQWAEHFAPAAVKTDKRILVSELKGKEDIIPRDMFDVIPSQDHFYITTSVQAEK